MNNKKNLIFMKTIQNNNDIIWQPEKRILKNSLEQK